MLDVNEVRVVIIGLGYVGLPLAIHMAAYFPVTGFDISSERVQELDQGVDRTLEVGTDELLRGRDIRYTTDETALGDANFYIVTVPTPIDAAKRPDLTALQKASETVGRVLSKGNVVVFESTVYPGATAEVCVPIMERVSGLKFNDDFFVGYSPERINPGDKSRRLPDIRKITSGSTPEAADLIDRVYSRVITAGTYKASSIRVAEAAKIIENIQRDVNIALINELSRLFKQMGLETREVLTAAGTKWNFHNYEPGLVGGHCIGVDPYYLTHKAQSIGFHPEMILAGRRINDDMPAWIAHDVIRTMLKHRRRVDGARVLIMGFTFKENCPDIRNTKIASLVEELATFSLSVQIYDPLAEPAHVMSEYGMELTQNMPQGPFDAIVLAVRHDEIVNLGPQHHRALLAPGGIIYDIKGILAVGASDGRL